MGACADDDSSSAGAEGSPSASAGDTASPSTDSDESGDAAVKTSDDASNRTKPTVQAPKGAPPAQLVQTDLIEGTGAEAKAGDEVAIQYVGVDFETGKEFESSWEREEPYSFELGASTITDGWNRGIEGMRVGGRRELIVPPDLAYGSAGYPPTVAPNATLVFVIDLIEVK